MKEESWREAVERNNFSLNCFDNSSFKVICSINICGDYFNQTLFNPEVTVLSGLKGDVPRELNWTFEGLLNRIYRVVLTVTTLEDFLAPMPNYQYWQLSTQGMFTGLSDIWFRTINEDLPSEIRHFHHHHTHLLCKDDDIVSALVPFGQFSFQLSLL